MPNHTPEPALTFRLSETMRGLAVASRPDGVAVCVKPTGRYDTPREWVAAPDGVVLHAGDAVTFGDAILTVEADAEGGLAIVLQSPTLDEQACDTWRMLVDNLPRAVTPDVDASL